MASKGGLYFSTPCMTHSARCQGFAATAAKPPLRDDTFQTLQLGLYLALRPDLPESRNEVEIVAHGSKRTADCKSVHPSSGAGSHKKGCADNGLSVAG